MGLYYMGIASDYISVVVAVYFSITFFFGDERDKIHSGLIMLSSVLMVCLFVFSPDHLALYVPEYSYIAHRNNSMVVTTCTAVMLSLYFAIDGKAKKLAAIYCVIAVTNLITSVELGLNQTPLGYLVYHIFDELIIIANIWLMVVSNGILVMVNAKLRSLYNIVDRAVFCRASFLRVSGGEV